MYICSRVLIVYVHYKLGPAACTAHYNVGYDANQWRLKASGTIKSNAQDTMCLEITHFKEEDKKNQVGIYHCHGTGGNQFLMMNEYQQLFYAFAASKNKDKSW